MILLFNQRDHYEELLKVNKYHIYIFMSDFGVFVDGLGGESAASECLNQPKESQMDDENDFKFMKTRPVL